MIEQGNFFFMYVFMTVVVLVVVSIIIPLAGFFMKKWKGLALGCVLQPLFCVIVTALTIFGGVLLWQYDLKRHEKGAMVVLKKVTDKASEDMHVNTWYIQDNGECFCDFGDSDYTGLAFILYGSMRFYDVIPMDSFRICVDDHVTVRFDLARHVATASEYDEPLKVDTVDWEKVSRYFENAPIEKRK